MDRGDAHIKKYIILQAPGWSCKTEHIVTDGIDDDGKVCHCYDELCNSEVPQPDPITTPGPGPDPSPDTTCSTSCTTTCSSNEGIDSPDTTCSTSCTTTCTNNQGINGK